MQKICAVILLLTALVSNNEALPQTKWSRQIRNAQGQLVRERRQFPFGEWIPLSQPCPTCRQFADPLDAGLKLDSIGLTPPRPPTVTRQIHGERNFFPQDESSILSVPPPPPSAIPRHPIGPTNGNFQNHQFNNFPQQFNNPLTVPTQQIFPQTQQIQFLPQTFLPNQQLLVNGNSQILPVLNNQNTLFTQEQGKQQINNGKVPKFNSEFKQPKPTENVLLEQNKRPAQPVPRPESGFRNKPSPFTPPPQPQQQQNQQQTFIQQQGFVQQQQQQPIIQQQQHSVNFGDSILTPPPAPNATAQGQNIVIPGLDKEEIQLLYVPVETLRQRGNLQEQLLAQQPQNIQFHNRPSASPSPVSPQINQQTTTKQTKGHFVTQEGNNNGEQSISTLKVTPPQPFPTTVTPSSLLLQHSPFQQTPQPFVSATPITPATPTIQPFVTPSSSPSKFSSFTPETTLSHLSTIPNAIQFSQPGLEFGTTAKSIFQEEIINGKSQFSNFKEPAFQGVQFQQPQVSLSQQQQQPFLTQQQQSERPPQQSSIFLQGQQQKDIQLQNVVPKQQLQDQQQILIQKQQEQQRLLQQQKEKDLQQKLLFERQQKEAEAQRLLAQRQKELEEQRILQQKQQQRQKELEEQRLLQQQRQKELEEQRLLQQRRQKELEEQRYLQQQKQKELDEQRFLQQQRQKELENQRQLQLQRQRELEEKRRLQLQKQREQEEQQRLLRLQQQQKEIEEQRLLRLQQQQKELEEQRLLQQQQEQQQRLLQQQKLQKQNQENLKKQQQYQFIQQQQAQQEALQQPNRHTLPVNDKLNSIAQLAKESEPDDSELVPHQPPLSVFFRGYEGAQPRIVDVLRELRSSNTITVLDQYFEKMPKVFVGPAGLIPPAGYGKFELPYLSNLETNRIEKKIDRLPFFVAPLNFIPPPGYSKIPFPAPHVGSVVISSETNPAMKVQQIEKENIPSQGDSDSGSYPVVGPEIPGLVNGLETETTTFKPAVFSSTPSLPQTTAQLRNRRPNSNLYRPQNRKPISKTRPQTTSKPEEEVTQPTPKIEKESESGIRKPFNRFLKRRRPQAKTTTESSVTNDQEGKNLENRFYSVEVYHKQKNSNTPRHHQFQEKQGGEHNQFEQQGGGNIDRTTPEGQNVYDIQPTPGFYKNEPTGSATESDERRPQILDYSGVNNLQTYEDGPFPTGSAKTITHELYRPNALRPTIHHQQQQQQQYDDSASSKFQPKPDTSLSLEKHNEVPETTKLTGISDVNPTAAFVGTTGQKSTVAQDAVKIQPTAETGFERQDITLGTSEKYYGNEGAYTPGSVTVPEEHKPTSFVGGDEQYTSAFAEISKHHHIPSPSDSPKRQQTQFSSDPQPSPELAHHLQAPFSEQHFSQQQHSQEYVSRPIEQARPTPNADQNLPSPQYSPVGPSNEQYSTNFAGVSNSEQSSGFGNTAQGQVNPTASGTPQEQYSSGFGVPNSNSQNAPVENTEDQRRPSFINFHNIQGTPEPTEKPQVQYFPSSTEGQPQEYGTVTETVKNYEYPKVIEQSYVPVTPDSLLETSETPSTQTYKEESVSEDLAQINEQKQTTEGQGQNFDDNLSSTHRLKIPNPSIVKVRTRVRGKSRGQLNFAASQTTTQAPYTRSKLEKNVDNIEQEYATKTNNLRDYQPVKVSKYNQYRGLKKPVRTTTESATEQEQKANVYTIRPQRRPSNPSTVSTKRIRRPTTPVPTVESSSDGISIITPGSQSHADESEFSPSGVSNDVYYEHSSFSPVRNKFRKHFGTPEEKSDVVPSYTATATAYPSTIRSHHLPTVQDHSNEEVNVIKDGAHSLNQDNYDRYPEWNPAESGIDVSGIVLTTTSAPTHGDQLEVEEPKKSQDSKKAFDPDLEKKSGRRRVRVRVHKRPHENFETAESQNLRTVANVLVPPTSTYKPNDESNLHQLVKNTDYSFGGQKPFGIRSRDYFRKRLNLTQTEKNPAVPEDTEEGNSERRQTIKTQADVQDEVPVTAGGGSGERLRGTKVRTYVRKVEKSQKKENESSEDSNAGITVTKHGRPKFRGYVRKIIKHGDAVRENGNESNQSGESSEIEAKQDNVESHPRPYFRGTHGAFNQTGRVNGTRHRTLVKYVKKNKIRTHETESHQETQTHQREEQTIHQTTESHTEQPRTKLPDVSESQTEAQQSRDEEISQTQHPVYHSTEQPEIKQTESFEPLETLKPVSTSEQQSETEPTEQPESRQTPETVRQTTQEPETERTLPQKSYEVEESEVRQTQPTEPPRTQETVQQYTQRTKYYQTLRPISQRPQYTGFHRTTESHFSTTERIAQEFQEKRDGPIRPKYGKTTGYGTSGTESRTEESKRVSEQQLEQQTRNKNSHIFEIRKYLRNKNREGAFSQFSKNRYYTSEKTETVETIQENNGNEDKSSEEITTPVETTPTASEPKTTNTFAPNADSVEVSTETPMSDEGIDTILTTEEIETSTEGAKPTVPDTKDITGSAQPETTTEGKTDFSTTLFQTSDRNDQITESKTERTIPTERNEISQTEIQPDLYRFSKSSFSFDETEKFTGTKNRAHVRNITADIIENTASFSAPGIDKHSVAPTTTNFETVTESNSDVSTNEKTEEAEATESNTVDTTTVYPDNSETETTAATEAVTKAKIAKLLKTSTTTKVSHETEICYKGKCIRTKSENPDEDLKLLVDSASTMKIEKPKT